MQAQDNLVCPSVGVKSQGPGMIISSETYIIFQIVKYFICTKECEEHICAIGEKLIEQTPIFACHPPKEIDYQ